MAMKSKPIDYWRDYFRNTNCDIFEVIEYSIMVAASDCPKEFRLRRDRVAELLYSCRWSGCMGCERVGSAVSSEEDLDDGLKSRFGSDGCDFEPGGSKESKANSCRDDQGELFVSNYSYGEAEALTDEIEEESQAVEEVFRLKEILLNGQDESDSVIYESLRRLQLMALSVGTLKATGIGKAVNHLRKHGSKQIGRLAQTLIAGWKAIVDEWFKTAPAAPEPDCTPDSVNPSSVDEEQEEEEEEEGLPSPPLDEVAFFATAAPIELSQFFDGMDDDGNPRTGGEFIKNRENGRRPSLGNQNLVEQRRHQRPQKPNIGVRDDKSQQVRKHDDVMKPSRPSNASSRPNVEQKNIREAKFQTRRTDQTPIQKRQLGNRQEEIKNTEETAVQMKLEATKRRLHESYQQVEKAKKQRTIQVMDLHDLPKQSRGQSNPHMRPGIQNRRLMNGRR